MIDFFPKTFINIIILWVVLYGLILLLNYRRKNLSKYSKEELQNSVILTKRYLDQFYITNKVFTFIKCFLYFLGLVSLFMVLRFITLDKIILLEFISIQLLDSCLYLVFYYIVIFIMIILYKTLLDLLFKKEAYKLYIYLHQFSWWLKYDKIIQFKPIKYMLGCIRIPCYFIGNLTYKEDMLIFDQQDIHADQLDYYPENKYFIQILLKIQNLAKRYNFIQKFFIILAYILRFIHVFLTGITKQLPYFILFMIFIIELYYKELHYIFLALFIFFIIKVKRDFEYYIIKKDYSLDLALSDYFYKNKISYVIQRSSFFQTSDKAMENPLITPQNTDLFQHHKKLLDYIFNNFVEQFYKVDKKIESIYRRFFTLLEFCLITYYFIIHHMHYKIERVVFFNIPIILVLLISIMVYTGYKAYYPLYYEEDPWMAKWKYNRNYNIIFWIIAAILGYIYWILLLYPELTLLDNEVLFDSDNKNDE